MNTEQELIDAGYQLTTNTFHSGIGEGKVYAKSLPNEGTFDDRNVEGGFHYEYFSVSPNGDVAPYSLNANVKEADVETSTDMNQVGEAVSSDADKIEVSETDDSSADKAIAVEADAETTAAEVEAMIDHEVTQEDLDENVELVEAGVKVGDVIKLPAKEEEADVESENKPEASV